MRISEVQDEIMRLKREKDICILAHSYQAREIIEIADFTGDSYQLSVAAENTPQKTVVMCGVRFMAETVKILSPHKTVILANPESGCPMAEQMDKEYINKVKKQYPDYTVVAYINTTAALKTICDVCVTSSSAVSIINKIENNNILFLPDCNLGAYVAEQLPHKNIKLLQGGCPVHAAVTGSDVEKAKSAHPNAVLLVHPECLPEVVRLADFSGSTSAIMDYAVASDKSEFLIGTEMSITENLQFLCPEKRFYCLSHKLICSDMKITTLMDVMNCVNGKTGTFGEEILLDETTIASARVCIDKMIELGD
ncbi:MAG: quinolinate synthase NadA [Oscillospiraceae bacterium]|nr:quinolinate synthase NadA [Oscillospiraceae bacterium]